MSSKYNKNRWDLYNPQLPNESQPHSFITKRKLDLMEQGIEDANVSLEVGEVKMSDDGSFGVTIVEDESNKTRKLNVTFPPAGKGAAGQDGKSAYEIWLEAGNTGTPQQFLDYLKGAPGKDGRDGVDGEDGAPGPAGQSAYQIWIAQGNSGTELDFLNSLKGVKGDKGDPGDSAYELWKKQPGNDNKTIIEFFASLKGEKGDPGEGMSAEFYDF